jgi:predicted TIM-barrel fold metal-dependent hydrolase
MHVFLFCDKYAKIGHGDFMRLRNVSGAKQIIETSKYAILNPAEYKGKYNTIFGNDNPIKIEIGMGKGRFIYNNALKYPDINFIICHMGIPWVLDTAELISKNKNVYTDMSGLISGSKKQIRRMKRERYYVDLIRQALVYADRYDKVLFGSDWPLMPIGSYIDYIKHVVPKRHWEEVFFQNALAVFPKMELALHML